MAGDLDGLTQPALALSVPEVAQAEGDGLLTMEEIMGLRLDADWVVRSVCNTASGDGAGAEAVSGLAPSSGSQPSPSPLACALPGPLPGSLLGRNCRPRQVFVG